MKTFWILSTLVFSIAHAQPPEVKARFEEHFYSDKIVFNDCTGNIERFVNLLARDGVLPAGFKVVTLKSTGSIWHIEDMLISLQCRFSNLDQYGHRLQYFYHHTFGLSEGLVYDFSFGPEPRILPLDQYLKEMFVPVTPFQPFGPGYRSRRVLDPDYEVVDAMEEIRRMKVQVISVTPEGQAASETDFPLMNDFLASEKCTGILTGANPES